MERYNGKKKAINYDRTIKKSNELSMAKMNQGLTLNQKQLLAFAIYCTQNNGKTEFMRKDFIDMFELNYYHTNDAYEDSDRISALRFSTSDLEKKKFRFTPIFSDLNYDDGKFTVEWNSKFIPHILELKEKYVLTDLTVVSNFKSGYSWILYDYLKACYGHWYRELSKGALMRLFNVEDRKTYQSNTNRFKKAVLEVAVKEINEFTELEVWYTDTKVGNKITGFTLHWSSGKRIAEATKKQLALLHKIHDKVEQRMIDYLSLKDIRNLESARTHIIAIKDIYSQSSKGLSSQEAYEYIQQAKEYYLQLEQLLEQDGQKRDTSFYYNWLEEDGG